MAPCPKMYYDEGAAQGDKKYKFSLNCIPKDKNDITGGRFEKVSTDQTYKDACANNGFRVVDNYMITYTQEKKHHRITKTKELLKVMALILYHHLIKLKTLWEGILFMLLYIYQIMKK